MNEDRNNKRMWASIHIKNLKRDVTLFPKGNSKKKEPSKKTPFLIHSNQLINLITQVFSCVSQCVPFAVPFQDLDTSGKDYQAP